MPNNYTDIVPGPATVWRAPVGEAIPDRDTIGFGVDWGGQWVTLGYTKTPVSWNFQTTVQGHQVEQVTGEIKQTKTQEIVMIETVLAELTGTNLKVAVDGTLTGPVAAGSGTVGYEEVEGGGDPTITEYAWGIEGEYIDTAGASFPIRFFLYRGTAIMNGPLTFAKADYPGISLQVKALNDTSKVKGKQIFKFQRVTAAGL